jgi:hypothetical protein
MALMLAEKRSLILATALLITPLVPAFAQQNNPTGNLGSNRSVTAAPGTADSQAASGVRSGDVTPHGTSNYGMMTAAPGHTHVPGTNSSTHSAAKATNAQKTGSEPSGGSGH